MKVICIADFAFDPIQSMLHQLFRLERFLPDLPLLIDHNFLVFSFTILTLFCSKSKKNANHFVLSLSTLSQDLFPPPPQLSWIFVRFTAEILLLDIVLFSYNNKKKDLGSITGEFQHLQYVYVTCRMIVLLAWNL